MSVQDHATEIGGPSLQARVRYRRAARMWSLVSVGVCVAALSACSQGQHRSGANHEAPLRISPAAKILNKGAAAVRGKHVPAPRGGQFIYVKQGSYRAWLSADGTHDGLVVDGGVRTPLYGCRNGRQRQRPDTTQTQPCTPHGAYEATMPTTKHGMTAYLTAGLDGSTATGAVESNALAKQALMTLEFSYLTAGSQAALFESMTSIDGLQVVSAGSGGVPAGDVGVTWAVAGGGSTTVLFDAASYQYDGVLTSGAGGESSTSILSRLAVVDKVGQVP